MTVVLHCPYCESELPEPTKFVRFMRCPTCYMSAHVGEARGLVGSDMQEDRDFKESLASIGRSMSFFPSDVGEMSTRDTGTRDMHFGWNARAAFEDYIRMQASGDEMSTKQREYVRRLMLMHGYKLKPQPDGSNDLNEYVYKAACALVEPQLTHARHVTEMLRTSRGTKNTKAHREASMASDARDAAIFELRAAATDLVDHPSFMSTLSREKFERVRKALAALEKDHGRDA